MNNAYPARSSAFGMRLLALAVLWLYAMGACAQTPPPLTLEQKAVLQIIQSMMIDGGEPQVILTAPVANAQISANVSTLMSATATDSDGTVAKVEFFANGVLVGTDTTVPYEATWLPTTPGSYSLTARATDNQGEVGHSAPVNVTVVANNAPSVTLTAPATNSSYGAPASIDLAATASDSDGTIAKVEFYRGSTLVATRTNAPYTAVDANAPGGTYSYTAKAYDNLGAVTTSAAVTVTVGGITLTAAPQNIPVAPGSITLTATPPSGTTLVEFFQGNTLLSTDNTAPYTFDWSNVPTGTYTFTARATGTYSGASTSSEVTVTVGGSGQQAQMYFIHPDHLNTPRTITNAAQQVVWRWDNSDPFGNNAPNENPSNLGNFTCNLRLPGQYFDKETNLHYNYFRDYDPAIGRYVQSDPIGLRGGLNTYAYVGGNPLSFTDPLGLQAIPFPRFPIPGFPSISKPSASNPNSTGSSDLDRALGFPGAASSSSSSSSSEAARARCEAGCDKDYDFGVKMCEASWKMAGRDPSVYRLCMNEVRAKNIKCFQDCAKDCK